MCCRINSFSVLVFGGFFPRLSFIIASTVQAFLCLINSVMIPSVFRPKVARNITLQTASFDVASGNKYDRECERLYCSTSAFALFLTGAIEMWLSSHNFLSGKVKSQKDLFMFMRTSSVNFSWHFFRQVCLHLLRSRYFS